MGKRRSIYNKQNQRKQLQPVSPNKLNFLLFNFAPQGMLVPIIRRNPRAGFALIDPLIGLLAVTTVMVGALNFWRLAEYKCDKARIDARVTQILRESSDYAAYLSYDRLPADGAQLRSGFLLHPLDPPPELTNRSTPSA